MFSHWRYRSNGGFGEWKRSDGVYIRRNPIKPNRLECYTAKGERTPGYWRDITLAMVDIDKLFPLV